MTSAQSYVIRQLILTSSCYAGGQQIKVWHRRINRVYIHLRCTVTSDCSLHHHQISQMYAGLQCTAASDPDHMRHSGSCQLFHRYTGRRSANSRGHCQHRNSFIESADTLELSVVRQFLHIRQLFCDPVYPRRISRQYRIMNSQIISDLQMRHNLHNNFLLSSVI